MIRLEELVAGTKERIRQFSVLIGHAKCQSALIDSAEVRTLKNFL